MGRGVLACSGDSWINFSLFPKNFKTPLDAEMVYFPWFVGQQLANWTPIWSWLISWLPNTPSWKICTYIYIYIYLCPLQHVVLFTSISNSTIIFPESFNVVADYEHIQDIRAYGIVWSLVWSKGGDNNIGEEKLESLLMMRKRELEMESERAFNFQACQMSICATKLN